MLLDTHVLLVLAKDPALVNPEAIAVLSDRTTRLNVSSISAYEIAQKVRLGKLQDPGLLATWSDALERLGILEVPVTGADAIEAGRLQWEHRDPFDRILVAQARMRQLRFVTRDARILGSGLVGTLEA